MGAGTEANASLQGGAPAAAPVYVMTIDFTFSSSYSTGGDDIDLFTATAADEPALPENATVLAVLAPPTVGVANWYEYDSAAKKMIAYVNATTDIVEVTAAVDISALGAIKLTVIAV